MTLPRHLSKRGNLYQFYRRVPSDVVDIVGRKDWRQSLETDSLIVAERKLREQLDITVKIIDDARNGALRKIPDKDLESYAIGWTTWYDQVCELTLPQAIIGSRFPSAPAIPGPPIGDEEPDPIIRSKEQLAGHVERYANHIGLKIDIPSPDWDALLSFCQDEYYWSNPEVADSKYFGSLGRSEQLRRDAMISVAFEKFRSERTRKNAEKPIWQSALKITRSRPIGS
jgi:hypothetical protein